VRRGPLGRGAVLYLYVKRSPSRKDEILRRTLVTRLYCIRMMPPVDLRAEGGEEPLQLLRDRAGDTRLWF
jgi:hypothetical protein